MKDDFCIFLLRKICKYFVKQGYSHKYKIKIYYDIMQSAAKEEFREDNEATLKAYLTDRFNDSLNSHPTIYI